MLGGAVFAVQALNQLSDAGQVVNVAHALAGRPHGFPGFGFVVDGFELFAVVHRALVLQLGQVKAALLQALAHKAGGHARDSGRVHDVGSFGAEDHVFVGLRRVVFLNGDHAGAEVSEVGPEHLRGQNFMAVVEAAGQQHGFVEELANFCDQGKGTPRSGMTAGASRDGNQTIDAGLGGFLGMAAGGDVVEYQTAVAVHRVDHFFYCTEAGDDDGHALLHADGQVGLQARVGVVHDEVDGVRRGVAAQACVNLVQPGFETAALALIQRGEAANDAVVTARQYQLRVGDQKHRCSNYR